MDKLFLCPGPGGFSPTSPIVLEKAESLNTVSFSEESVWVLVYLLTYELFSPCNWFWSSISIFSVLVDNVQKSVWWTTTLASGWTPRFPWSSTTREMSTLKNAGMNTRRTSYYPFLEQKPAWLLRHMGTSFDFVLSNMDDILSFDPWSFIPVKQRHSWWVSLSCLLLQQSHQEHDVVRRAGD